MKKGNNTYTDEFRKEAADLVIKQGYTVAEAGLCPYNAVNS